MQVLFTDRNVIFRRVGYIPNLVFPKWNRNMENAVTIDIGYLQPILDKYCDESLLVASSLDCFVSQLTLSQTEEIYAAYKEISHRDDSKALSEIVHSARDVSHCGFIVAWRRIQTIFAIFERLADVGVPEFSGREVAITRERPLLDWGMLPPHLSYLISDAQQYGQLQFDTAIHECVIALESHEISRLKKLECRMASDASDIEGWLSNHSIRTCREAALVYFLQIFLADAIESE